MMFSQRSGFVIHCLVVIYKRPKLENSYYSTVSTGCSREGATGARSVGRCAPSFARRFHPTFSAAETAGRFLYKAAENVGNIRRPL
jgi:hypothetical protein